MMAPHERELVQKLKELRDHVVKNADNVGKKFADEARKMHYGDIAHRAIYGEATADEARALTDEGARSQSSAGLARGSQLKRGPGDRVGQ